MRMRTLFTTASAMALSFGVMTGAACADSNRLMVEQVGTANYGPAQQKGSQNETYVSQDGNYNSAGAGVSDSDGAYNNNVLVKQTGNRNVGAFSFVRGGDPLDGNTLGIVQNGNRNYSNLNLNQDQGGLENSTIFIEQNGSYNVAGPASTGGNFPAGNGQYAASINLAGISHADLTGPNGSGAIGNGFGNQLGKVRGDNQFVGIVQDGVSNAFAFSMEGNGNEIGGAGAENGTSLGAHSNEFFDSAPAISAPGDAGSYGVSGLAVQNGTSNVGVVEVSGTNNAAGFTQVGNNNLAEVYQSGSHNNTVAHQR